VDIHWNEHCLMTLLWPRSFKIEEVDPTAVVGLFKGGVKIAWANSCILPSSKEVKKLTAGILLPRSEGKMSREAASHETGFLSQQDIALLFQSGRQISGR
jgi:hypothetical protein